MDKRKVPVLIIIFLIINESISKEIEDTSIEELFNNINREYIKLLAIGAQLSWESSINPHNSVLPGKTAEYEKELLKWQQSNCAKLVALINHQVLNKSQGRQTYLLCRGPVYTLAQARESSNLYDKLSSIYSETRICIPTTNAVSKNKEGAILNYLSFVRKYLRLEPNVDDNVFAIAVKASLEDEKDKNNTLCMGVENELKDLMSISRNEDVLKFVWLGWREAIGPPILEPFLKLIDIENNAAKRNGYHDIGAAWREELELPDLRNYCLKLYKEVKPFYVLLHGVMRHFLRNVYGNIVPEKGLIPAHLLGDMWSQNWESLADLIDTNILNLDKSIKTSKWSIEHMVKRAEDFYQSLGFPAMTDKFWKYSVFTNVNDKANGRCHGSAADMYDKGDFRILYCSGTSMEDFSVIHHEMGHIHYFMAYEQQPGIFRGANSALHESIGDAIMYGVLTPQHLNRLGLINDSYLYTNDFNVNDREYLEETNIEEEEVTASNDELFLLKTALNKIPQIPFALLIDKYRWRHFEGDIKEGELNKEFWKMAQELQGIGPPDGDERAENYFDVGAKFHVPDNTPYIRYYLSSFLQLQIFEALCKVSIFGRRHMKTRLPNTIPLSRCDIYGSKPAGKLLKEIMSRGNSENWREILQSTIGVSDISVSSLKRYYQPLKKYLRRLVTKYNIPLGW